MLYNTSAPIPCFAWVSSPSSLVYFPQHLLDTGLSPFLVWSTSESLEPNSLQWLSSNMMTCGSDVIKFLEPRLFVATSVTCSVRFSCSLIDPALGRGVIFGSAESYRTQNKHDTGFKGGLYTRNARWRNFFGDGLSLFTSEITKVPQSTS